MYHHWKFLAVLLVSGTLLLAQQTDVQRIQQELTQLRGLTFKQNVPSEKQSLEEFKKYVEAELAATFPAEKFAKVQKGLLRLGLLKNKIDLKQEVLSATLSQAAAYYDPKKDKFYYLMSDMPPQVLQTTAAHELVHALQDQHFQLETLMDRVEKDAKQGIRNDDQILAFRFLVEGEATCVQMMWQMRQIFALMGKKITPSVIEPQLAQLARMDIQQILELTKAALPELDSNPELQQSLESADKIPPYILHPLYMAYLNGASFVAQVYKYGGGWRAVNSAYDNLPQTTEQCLHPLKYIREKDNPTSLRLPDFPYLQGKWRKIDEAIHGEVYLTILLKQHEIPKLAAQRATMGWDGDIYRAYENNQGEVMIVLATTWDTPKDAKEFYQTYQQALNKKYPSMKKGKKQTSYKGNGQHGGYGVLLHRDREVFQVEGVDRETLKKMIKDLQAQTINHIK